MPKQKKVDLQLSEETTPPDREWTVMMYFEGDNNLNDEMIRALDALRSGFGTSHSPSVALLAQFHCSHPGIGTQRFNFLFPREQPIFITDDSADKAASILDFVKACVLGDPQNPRLFPGYPAKRYSLILSGHADGLEGRTLLMDESPFGVLKIQDLFTLMRDVKRRVTKKKVSILGIDSCLMNTLEISYSLRDEVDLLVASQGNIPNSGWGYPEIAHALSILDPQHCQPEHVATKIFTESLRFQNKPFLSLGGRSLELSTTDLRVFGGDRPEILGAIESLADVLLSALEYKENYEDLEEDKYKEYHFPRTAIERLILISHWRCQGFLDNQSIDLKDFCVCLRSEIQSLVKDFSRILESSDEKFTRKSGSGDLAVLGDLVRVCKEVIDAVDRMVKLGIFSGSDSEYANGVSLFFPWTALAYGMARDQYEDLDFYFTDAGAKWTTFVKYFCFLTRRLPRNRSIDAKGRQNPPFFKGLTNFEEYFGRIKNYPSNFTRAEGNFPSTYNR